MARASNQNLGFRAPHPTDAPWALRVPRDRKCPPWPSGAGLAAALPVPTRRRAAPGRHFVSRGRRPRVRPARPRLGRRRAVSGARRGAAAGAGGGPGRERARTVVARARAAVPGQRAGPGQGAAAPTTHEAPGTPRGSLGPSGLLRGLGGTPPIPRGWLGERAGVGPCPRDTPLSGLSCLAPHLSSRL